MANSGLPVYPGPGNPGLIFRTATSGTVVVAGVATALDINNQRQIAEIEMLTDVERSINADAGRYGERLFHFNSRGMTAGRGAIR